MQVSGIVLAGGRSSRMGQDKTLMSVKSETLIERTVKELRKAVDEIIIASNQTGKYNLIDTRETPDIYPGMGPLGGIHAGLSAAAHQYSLVVAADMPLFSADLANYLLERCEGYDVIAPELNGRWEPLCAVYSKVCLPAIERCLSADLKKVHLFYPQVRVLKISEAELARIGIDSSIFCNMNTPQDYRNLINQNKPICSNTENDLKRF